MGAENEVVGTAPRGVAGATEMVHEGRGNGRACSRCGGLRESGVRVDGGSDGPTNENMPDRNDGTNGWNVHGGGVRGEDWESLDPPLPDLK